MDEDLFAPRFRGARPWVEAWYVIVRPEDAAWALWARYTVLSPARGEARSSVWGLAFPPGRTAHVARRVDHPGPPLRLAGAPFAFETGAGALADRRARGSLPDVAWDLEWEAEAAAYTLLPWARMLGGPFPRLKVATPVPSARARGTVEIAGEKLSADGARLLVGHTWGQSHAIRWAWTHAADFPGSPGSVFEAVTGVPFRGAPPLSLARFAHDGIVHDFRALRTLTRAASSFRPLVWRLEARARGARVLAEMEAADDDVLAVEYTDPSGGTRVCHGCERAAIRLLVEPRSGPPVRLEGRCSVEVGLPDVDPRFRTRL